jgi:hypothetical protein
VGTVVLAVALILAMAGCGRAPELPANDAATYQALTGVDGQAFLHQISTHGWDDGGRAVAERLTWIARDAQSTDATKALQAGQAAHAIATFLSDTKNKDELLRLSAGWFGLKHRSVGELNPELVRGYASALTPFQGALSGYVNDVPGYTMIGDPFDLSGARNVFALVDTDTQAGNQFIDAAYRRVHDYLKAYAQAVVHANAEGKVALPNAAALAGVAEGGQRKSGNSAIHIENAQHWINWAGYEVAKAMNARRGDPDIADHLFGPDGILKSPDQVSPIDLDTLSTALQNFVFHRGLQSLSMNFNNWYDAAAGK